MCLVLKIICGRFSKKIITKEEYSIRYFLRATFPARDDSFITEKAIEILPSEWDEKMLKKLITRHPRTLIFCRSNFSVNEKQSDKNNA